MQNCKSKLHVIVLKSTCENAIYLIGGVAHHFSVTVFRQICDDIQVLHIGRRIGIKFCVCFYRICNIDRRIENRSSYCDSLCI